MSVIITSPVFYEKDSLVNETGNFIPNGRMVERVGKGIQIPSSDATGELYLVVQEFDGEAQLYDMKTDMGVRDKDFGKLQRMVAGFEFRTDQIGSVFTNINVNDYMAVSAEGKFYLVTELTTTIENFMFVFKVLDTKIPLMGENAVTLQCVSNLKV